MRSPFNNWIFFCQIENHAHCEIHVNCLNVEPLCYQSNNNNLLREQVMLFDWQINSKTTKNMSTIHKKKRNTRREYTYFCLSLLYEDVSSSNSFEFISIKVFKTLYTSATMVLKRKRSMQVIILSQNIHCMVKVELNSSTTGTIGQY